MTKQGKQRKRLDVRVLELGLTPTRQAAHTAIMDGAIMVDGQIITKPGVSVNEESRIALKEGWGQKKYASRGGLKLEKALQIFQINVDGRICLDIGASTGGFTDCLLKHGANLIYAVDVGYGQLDWSLRQNSRIVIKEKTNARYLTPEVVYNNMDKWADLVTIDVSFISVAKILPACLQVVKDPNTDIICLIKPQFEARKSDIGKGGVVKSQATHVRVLESLMQATSALGLVAHGLTFSPITGPAGNIEYLIHWRLDSVIGSIDVPATVETAHQHLAKV